jgi:hypothetical protein
MARAKSLSTPIDDIASKASSNWWSITKVFPRWRDRLGSSEAAKAQLRALFDDPETRLRIRRVGANGKEVFDTRRSVGVEFCQRHLSVVSDPDSGDDQIAVNYGEPYVDYDTPGGRWVLEVRRRDIEHWEGLHPELAAAAPSTTVGAKPAASASIPKFVRNYIADNPKTASLTGLRGAWKNAGYGARRRRDLDDEWETQAEPLGLLRTRGQTGEIAQS